MAWDGVAIRRILWAMKSLFLLTLAAHSMAIGGTDKPLRNTPITAFSVMFACDGAKYIDATWLSETVVHLKLSDKRQFFLPRTTSASGERYANRNETLIFWLKGKTTFIWEKDVETFQNCVAAPERKP